MPFPDVAITSDDSLQLAVEKVEKAYLERGAVLMNLNAVNPASSASQLLQASFENEQCILVVVTSPWDEKLLLSILNMLLAFRADPDPPGPPPRVRFYSAHDVHPVLLALFGDSPACGFESRAVGVAHFGNDLQPSQAFQLAAVAMHLLRENLGVDTSFYHPEGEKVIAGAIIRWFRGEQFPEGGAPLNSVIVLGFLFGELLRARLPYSSRWVRIKEYAPWPAIAFGPPEPSLAKETSPDEAQGVPQVVFSPIASVIGVYQEGAENVLLGASEALVERCEEEFQKRRLER